MGQNPFFNYLYIPGGLERKEKEKTGPIGVCGLSKKADFVFFFLMA
jgi:hypothetical protein